MTKPGGADHQFKQLIDRILRCRQAEDDAKADTKDVYAELKSLGYDKTGAGELVAELRKKDKDAAGFEERSAILDLYREAYERASGTVVATHVHTREEFPRAAGDIETGDGCSGAQAVEIGADLRNGSDRSGQRPAVRSGGEAMQAETASAPVIKDASPSPAPVSAMTAKTKADVMRLLRPFCQHADDTDKCGGHGSKHCHTCQLLADTARATA